MSQKALKRREPQSHEDTKFFPGLSELRLADKKIVLCALVTLWFRAFMLFTTKVGVDCEKDTHLHDKLLLIGDNQQGQLTLSPPPGRE